MNTTKNFGKKILKMAFLLGFFSFMLFIFYSIEKNVILKMKPYYITKIYAPVYASMAKNAIKDFSAASVLSMVGVNAKKNPDNGVVKNTAKSVPILVYHGIVGKPDDFNVLADDFREQMLALKNEGWKTVKLDDFEKFMRGEKSLPEKSFLITFDDGRKDSYYPADPILKMLDYNAVMFVITKESLDPRQNSKFYLNNDELKKMINSGRWEIEAHTDSGHDLYQIDKDGNLGRYYSYKLWVSDQNRRETDTEHKNRILYDFVSAKSRLENSFKINVDYFAFPFGDYGQNETNYPDAKKVILNSVEKIYGAVFFQVWRGGDFMFNYPGTSSDYPVAKRIFVAEGLSSKQLSEMLAASAEKPLPVTDTFEKNTGWTRILENSSIGGYFLNLRPVSGKNGANTFLDGSYTWTDYDFQAKIQEINGATFSIMARYQSDNNFVACSYGDKNIRIEEYHNGQRKILAELFKESGFRKNSRMNIQVSGSHVRCLLNDSLVAQTDRLSPELSHGAVGFKIWDPKADTASLTVGEINANNYGKAGLTENKN